MINNIVESESVPVAFDSTVAKAALIAHIYDNDISGVYLEGVRRRLLTKGASAHNYVALMITISQSLHYILARDVTNVTTLNFRIK